MQMEYFLGDLDNLRMIPLGTRAPLQLNLGCLLNAPGQMACHHLAIVAYEICFLFHSSF